MSAIRSVMRSVLREKTPTWAIIPEDDYTNEWLGSTDGEFHYFGQMSNPPPIFFPLINGELPLSLSVDGIIAHSNELAVKFARFWHIPCIQIIHKRGIKSLFGDLLIYYSQELMEAYQRPGLVITPYIDENFTYSSPSIDKHPIILADLTSDFHLELAKNLVKQSKFKIQTVNKVDKQKRLEQYQNSTCFVQFGGEKYPSYALEAASFGLPIISTEHSLELQPYASLITNNINIMKVYINNLRPENFKKVVAHSGQTDLIDTIMEYSNNYIRVR